MYVLVSNDAAAKYPYSVYALRADNPQVSFPAEPTDNLLAAYGVYPVAVVDAPPFNEATHRLVESTPVQIGSTWTQVWQVQPLTSDEIAANDAAQAAEVRAQRNQKLAECDWTQLPDAPLNGEQKFAWGDYRQKLRDVSAQAGFPWQVVWPVKPA